jgi:hypothetical protein
MDTTTRVESTAARAHAGLSLPLKHNCMKPSAAFAALAGQPTWDPTPLQLAAGIAPKLWGDFSLCKHLAAQSDALSQHHDPLNPH